MCVAGSRDSRDSRDSRESRGSRDSNSIEVLSAPSSPSEQQDTQNQSSSQIGRNPLRSSKCMHCTNSYKKTKPKNNHLSLTPIPAKRQSHKNRLERKKKFSLIISLK